MNIRKITGDSLRGEFNKRALHPMQSYEWGEFRKKTGVSVSRYGIFENDSLIEPIQATIHSIPGLPYKIGYVPKGYFPSKEQVEVLREIARENNCLFIKIEPMSEVKGEGALQTKSLSRLGFVPGRPLFTKYNFVLDLEKSEDELMEQMKSKTRYNVRYAKRKGVKVEVDNSKESFEEYIRLTKLTTDRQGFYAHSPAYHRKMWESLSPSMASIMRATYEGETLVTWVLFKFNDTLYYPYGASSSKHRNLMASNLVMWEAIKYGKREGLKHFDMWGALEEDPDKSDPWYGFHKFKEGYGSRHVEYVGTYDYVARPVLYKIFKVVNSLRWFVLRLVKR